MGRAFHVDYPFRSSEPRRRWLVCAPTSLAATWEQGTRGSQDRVRDLEVFSADVAWPLVLEQHELDRPVLVGQEANLAFEDRAERLLTRPSDLVVVRGERLERTPLRLAGFLGIGVLAVQLLELLPGHTHELEAGPRLHA